MNIKRPHIILDGIQIKSVAKFKAMAEALNTIEEECGIHEVRFTFQNVFFCPWIDKEQCRSTPMERFLLEILEKLEK